MPEREPTSVNLRVDHKEWMDSESINRSQLINELLEEYRESPNGSDAVKRLRAQQLKSEITSLQERLTTKENELDSLESEITTTKEYKTQVWEKALSDLKFSDVSYADTVIIESSDADVEYYADELGMPVDEFRAELKRRYEDGR